MANLTEKEQAELLLQKQELDQAYALKKQELELESRRLELEERKLR